MARTKEFDREDALAGALDVFWTKGYQAASTDDLLKGMKIGRQSMYDTFGDKQALFLECLRTYHKLNNKHFFDHLGDTLMPLEVLHGILSIFTRRSAEENARGCMGINATTATGHARPEVTALARGTATRMQTMLAEVIDAAKARGDLASRVNTMAAASFLYATLQGLTVRAQAGASQEELAAIADFAIEALSAM